jgi:hypothetical protein
MEKDTTSNAKETHDTSSPVDDTPLTAEQDAEKAISAEEVKSSQAPPLDWDDEHDPDNPFNWPEWKRAYNTVVPGLLGLAV